MLWEWREDGPSVTSNTSNGSWAAAHPNILRDRRILWHRQHADGLDPAPVSLPLPATDPRYDAAGRHRSHCIARFRRREMI